jgi:hypothetical protein
MKKAIFLLLFALSATMAFANKTLPDQGLKGDPVKEVLAAVQAASEVAEGEAPCRVCGTCKGEMRCVSYSCGFDACLNAAAELVWAEICNLGCCYENEPGPGGN